MEEFTSGRKRLVLAALCATMFMAMLDNVIVNNALPRIGQQLHAGVSGLQWVVEGYSLVYAALLLTGGTLGDRYGRKRIFLTGLALFTAGSAAAALSGSIGLLIAARMLQGLGAALLTPGSLSILRHVFTDEKERARAVGLWSGVSALGLAIGPVLGGPMVDAFGWASVFWINVPIGAAGLLLAAWVLPEFAGRARRVDLPGQLLSVLGFGALVYALIEGPARGWTDTRVLTLAAAAVALLAFVAVELRTTDPMLDLHFFRDPVLSGAAVSGFMISFGMFGASFFLPLLMQDVMGWTPSNAGLAGLPMTAMIVIAAPLSGTLTARCGSRIPLVTGLTLCAAALGGLSLYGEHARYLEYLWVLLAMGLGMGMTFTPVSVMVMKRVPLAQAGMASATLNMLREIGGVVGVAALGAVLTSRLAATLTGSLDRLDVPPETRHGIEDSVAGTGANGTQALPAPVHDAVNAAFVEGLHLALRCGGAAMVTAAVLVAVLLRPASSQATAPAGEPTQQDEPAYQ
ncbi:MFS transporter [Streptomyces sp. NBC_01363]|uniref:MFS transporter n=1 Tax=Streptomyces sp. NBC_01363 TaxID=2903840 RepID=UPI002254B7DF|nr:MFS transporter [Streptomyces sp. NBC_01363]MCX4734667.1 MFS transporter [Streptomyces sp. NBC_01363]